jgi:hypothetical protein
MFKRKIGSHTTFFSATKKRRRWQVWSAPILEYISYNLEKMLFLWMDKDFINPFQAKSEKSRHTIFFFKINMKTDKNPKSSKYVF